MVMMRLKNKMMVKIVVVVVIVASTLGCRDIHERICG